MAAILPFVPLALKLIPLITSSILNLRTLIDEIRDAPETPEDTKQALRQASEGLKLAAERVASARLPEEGSGR